MKEAWASISIHTKEFFSRETGISEEKRLNNATVKERKTEPSQETISQALLSLKKKTSWSWERICSDFHRVMAYEGPSHTTLFRYATGKFKRNVVTERYVRDAIHKITVELIKKG